VADKQVQSKFFGPVEYREDTIFHFPQGLPGFEAEVDFVPLTQPATDPIVFLQSIATPELCFMTMPVLVVDNQYRLQLSPEDLQALELSNSEPKIGTDILCLAILTVVPDHPPTVNLMSPIAVNINNRRGVQVIQLETQYSHQQSLPEGTC
jgi:flagellar assembly factor FliW